MPIKLHFLLFFVLFFTQSNAQYIFKNLQKKDGLSANDVICALKDSEGFMWFGTANGLNRYDGNHFKNFNKINKNSRSTDNLFISCIKPFGRSKFWIGTKRGLFIFDKTTENFTPVLIFESGKKKETSIQIDNMFFDYQNRLWMVSINGIFLVKNEGATPIFELYKNTSFLKNETIIGSTTKPDNIRKGLWVSTLKGLNFLDFSDGSIRNYDNNPEKLPIFDNVTVYAISLDLQNNIWISDENHPLMHYNFTSKQVKTFKNGIATQNFGLFHDFKNRLWLQNYGGKIQVLDGGKIFNFPEGSPDSYKICNIFFYNIYEDNEQNIWITGQNGVSKLANNSYLENILTLPTNLFSNEKVEYQINDLFDAGDNQIWVAKDDGLYLFNQENGKTQRFSLSKASLQPNRIFEVKFINGKYWCGTGNGIQIFNPKTKIFRPFKNYAIGHDLSKISVIWILQDKNGAIWFSAWANAVYKFDPKTNKTIRIDEIHGKKVKNADALTNSLCAFENVDGKIWINNGEEGITIYDAEKKAFLPLKSTNNITVYSICNDLEQNIWLSTSQKGILKFDRNGNLLDSITTTNGLYTNAINKISFDKYNRIWAASIEGMQYFDPKTKLISELNVDMGNPYHDLSGSVLIKDDKVFANSVNKLAIINLNQLTKKSSDLITVISSIRIFEKEIQYSQSKPKLDLKYNQNFFSIEFSTLEHSENQSIKYAYKLVGFDKDWVFCGRRQIASYTNVPNGQYDFLVKCINTSAENAEKITKIAITIQPPFWKTWWFVSTILGLLGFVFFRFYQFNSQKKQAEMAVQQQELKVLEINKMLAESQLMALRAQMNPHFVFNCLNSIQECIVTEKYGEASKYLNKFSKLFRMILNNSSKNLIAIDEEIEVLKLYLELEQMRFENSFEYSISIDSALDVNEILIPSMLLQPYVENALWHGLMHKAGNRKLTIEFSQKSEEAFECIIDDNGIGRQKSAELKAGQSKAKPHESKGLAITKARLDVLRKQGYHAELQIIDKIDNRSKAAGTKIKIELSTELSSI